MARILVSEDDEAMRQFLAVALARSGHDVVAVGDGDSASRNIEQDDYDLLLADIRMPGIDGNGVVKHIRNSDKQSIPVIAISGTPWLMESNAFDMVLAKPFPLKKLVDSIRSFGMMAPQEAVGMS